MTKDEQEKVMEKAKLYAENELKRMEDRFKAAFIRDALYCAYLEGAGIRTK